MLSGRLRFEVKVGEKNLQRHQAFKFKFSEKSWKIGGSKTQADSASQAAYPQQLVLSFSDYDQIMMCMIIDQGSKKTIETDDVKVRD